MPRPAKKIILPKMEEIYKIARCVDPPKIVLGEDYLYFAIQTTQEEISLRLLAKNSKIECYAVKNFKNANIGYIIRTQGKPKINANEFGAALFYSKEPKKYKRIKVLFSDSKIRVLSFDAKDFFVSVKWKSNNPIEG